MYNIACVVRGLNVYVILDNPSTDGVSVRNKSIVAIIKCSTASCYVNKSLYVVRTYTHTMTRKYDGEAFWEQHINNNVSINWVVSREF